MHYTRFTVNLDASQVEQLNALARQHGISASALCRYAIGRWLREPVLFLPAVHDGSKQDANPKQAATA